MNYKQAQRIKELKGELQYIKFKLSEELYKNSLKIERMKKEKIEMEQEYTSKSDEVKDHLELKNKELKNLRYLAKATVY